MKITIRIFALTIALVGLSTSSFSRQSPRAAAYHPSALSEAAGMNSMPIPMCGPYLPTCPPGCKESGCPGPSSQQ